MKQVQTSNQVFYPVLRYQDAWAAIDWLKRAFGLEEAAVYDDPGGRVHHAELRLGGGIVMLASSGGGAIPVRSPREIGETTASIYVYVADPDAHFARAKAAGARILREPMDQDYGSREYSALDPEGYSWSFGTYKP
jgi:uncharacterized glyoxalase superfamily protein PhnB